MKPKTDMDVVGEALYGSRWQTEMARAMGIAVRTAVRWAAQGRWPAGKRERLKGLVWDRMAGLMEARKLLDGDEG